MSSLRSSSARGRYLLHPHLRHSVPRPTPTPTPSSLCLALHYRVPFTPSARPLSIHAKRPVLPSPSPRINPYLPSSVRQITQSQSSTGKSQPDLLVEELQELYENAKDEFEIATDSTDGATIYAASDRESARDALDELLAVFALYTTELAEGAGAGVRAGAEAEAEEEDAQGKVVSTNFDPADIAPEVREEVRRRVGHRVRELQNAVEALEERAHAE
ncbi:uncharacterized protein ACLA_025440 [Aspergillus clavatus NRRL 1]|uniref:3-oxoacyl-(Acyl-carrier-protein) reductase n=1 Tax=Aspergillus clavatus (strain ATCC 1007 / CBS 513.65 / DSM 816 / NCTC 3887 / NRRL 1 / QM 1276 / 107) TaxID=344612 RepID=A1CQA6_ASPCL|nr:3-oxoacyl-(acyl-carrier-protein) reductase [Aspergillus clavatus NRRL 1]EAW07827.1 3-oxoacyl-(acyl-carrier-protein) reductase [Aspergillus clavatus NRRL 1]